MFTAETIILNLKQELLATAGPMSIWTTEDRESFRQLSNDIKQDMDNVNDRLRQSALLRKYGVKMKI